MKKVAIITITNSGYNFGNRLQNYALQQKLLSLGVEVETIISANECFHSITASRIRRKLKQLLKTDERRRNFSEFNKQFIKTSNDIRYGTLNDQFFGDKYDAFVSGSDQVWNPNFHFNSEFEFLTFAPPRKRYSYAASFGVDCINEEVREQYTNWINNLKKISVREESGAKIVQKLTGREALVHIDPTMLLDKEEYNNIEKKVENLKEKYLLVYFLGNITEEYRTFIKNISKRLNLKTIELSESKDSSFYNIGPSQFLYLFHHAEYVCTDSFHGSVFSIIYQKNFCIFTRKDNDVPMNSRIETLIQKFELSDRVVDLNDMEQSLMPIKYEEINKILFNEKMKADAYFNEMKATWDEVMF